MRFLISKLLTVTPANGLSMQSDNIRFEQSRNVRFDGWLYGDGPNHVELAPTLAARENQSTGGAAARQFPKPKNLPAWPTLCGVCLPAAGRHRVGAAALLHSVAITCAYPLSIFNSPSPQSLRRNS